MQTAKWMWADASLIGHGVAKVNPLRWSHTQSIEDILSDLERVKIVQPAKAGRPVTVHFQDKSCALGNQELEKVYPNVDSAISGLHEHLSTECLLPQDDGTSESTDGCVKVPLQALHSHLTCDSTVIARCMWDNVGLTVGLTKVVPQYRCLSKRNPFRWSEWSSLEETIGILREETGNVEHAVNLQVNMKSPEHGEVKYGTTAPNVVAAIATLQDLVTSLTKEKQAKSLLKDRADFVAEVGQESAEDSYQDYIGSIMMDNGGYVGVAVRFTSKEPHPFIRNGQEGIIQQFNQMSSFTVNWGLHSASVGTPQCTMLATANKRLHLAGVSADGVLFNLMHHVNARLKSLSGNAKQIETFERTCKRCVQVYTYPCIGYIAAETGMCHTLVEAMTKDREQPGGPTECVQSTGCLMLWWITCSSGAQRYSGECHKEEDSKALNALKAEVVEANSFSALVEARIFFPQSQDLVRAACAVVSFLIQDCKHFHDLALAAGWRNEWLLS